jgi:hypothetical protein
MSEVLVRLDDFREHESGTAILDDVYSFLGRFVAYPSEHAHVAHTLWIAHTHLMDAWGLDATNCLSVGRTGIRQDTSA